MAHSVVCNMLIGADSQISQGVGQTAYFYNNQIADRNHDCYRLVTGKQAFKPIWQRLVEVFWAATFVGLGANIWEI